MTCAHIQTLSHEKRSGDDWVLFWLRWVGSEHKSATSYKHCFLVNQIVLHLMMIDSFKNDLLRGCGLNTRSSTWESISQNTMMGGCQVLNYNKHKLLETLLASSFMMMSYCQCKEKNKVVKKTMVSSLVIFYSLLVTGVFFVGVTLSTSSFPTFSGVFICSSRAVLCCLSGDLEFAAFSGERVLFLVGFLVLPWALGMPINRKHGE